MKKSIVLFVSLSVIAFTAMAQMQGSNLPRFVRWADNNQVVVNTKLNGEKTAKDYLYNISTKQYTAAPAVAARTIKSVLVKNANVYLKENGVETHAACRRDATNGLPDDGTQHNHVAFLRRKLLHLR